MPSLRVPREFNSETFFVTFTVFRWYYIFDRYNRWDLLANSIQYCMKNKDLKLVAFVFMLNHIHLIISSSDVAGFIRDFKKFTSKEMKRNIIETERHILRLFNNNGSYQFWQRTNAPKLIDTVDFYEQKLNYIHENPIVKNFVMKPEDWYWSSANKYCELKPNNYL
ncbi:MAG: transposase [Patescibacteria group bacterium]|nr:transposase [Patescibacteria group bacterium]